MKYLLLYCVIPLTIFAPLTCKLLEEDLAVPDLIRYWNYPVQVHHTYTADGYGLTLHRIPHGRWWKNDTSMENCTGKNALNRPVVFLQHGLLTSSSNWVENLPGNSLAFLLADAGYDVWMGNVRGNTYSSTHETYPIDSYEYWDFSFHEMGMFDLPAMLEYVVQCTGERLYYIGHSQGIMMLFPGINHNSLIQKHIKMVFALAPATRLKNIYSPLKYLAIYRELINVLFRVFNTRRFLPSSKFVRTVTREICDNHKLHRLICRTVLNNLAGYDTKDYNMTRMPVFLSHSPAGTSLKNINHFAQLIESQKFHMYDYGFLGNLLRYRTLWPPEYRINDITIPMHISYGSDDWLAAPKDVKWMAGQISQLESIQEIQGYNHLDFLWAMSAKQHVYEGIMKTIEKKEKENC